MLLQLDSRKNASIQQGLWIAEMKSMGWRGFSSDCLETQESDLTRGFERRKARICRLTT